MFSDLECDYINPIDLCDRLNQVITKKKGGGSCALLITLKFVLPEMGAHAFLFFMFFLTGNWTAALLNIPLLAHNARK